MNTSPWPARILLAILAVALFVGAAGHWWMPRPFPG